MTSEKELIRLQAEALRMQAEALRGKRSGQGQGTSSTLAEAGRAIDDVIRGAADMITFGFADEAAAGMNTLTGLGPGESYEENVAAERARDEAGGAARVVGQVGGALLTAPKTAAAAARFLPGAGRMPGFTKSVLGGGAAGGLYGAGSAEGGPEERLKGAAGGAAVGAAAGGVLYPAVKAGEAAIRAGARGIQNRMGPEGAAQRKLMEAIERDQMTVAKVRQRLRNLGPQATISDAGGENVAGLARAAAGVPGPAKNRAAQVLNSRAQGEAGRIMAKVNKNLRPKDYFAAEDEFLATLKRNAAEIYQEAYQAGKHLESKALTRLLERPIAKNAMKEAADLAGIEGRRLSQLDPSLTAQAKEAVQRGLMDPRAVPKGGIGRGITTEAVDDLKRGIDSLIERETNPLTGALNKRGFLMAEFKRELLREVDRLNPLYAKARLTYAGDAEVLTALREGRRALKLDPEQIGRVMDGMSDAAKEAYRSGAARAIKDAVDATPDTTSAARRLFGKDVMRERIRAVFPDQDTYNDLARTLVGEQRFQQVRNMVLGGSPTAPRLAEQVDIGVDPNLVQGAIEGRGGVVSGLVRAGVQRLTQPNPNMANELSRIMFNRNQPMNLNALDQIMRRAQLSGANQQQIDALEQALIRALAKQGAGAGGYNQRP